MGFEFPIHSSLDTEELPCRPVVFHLGRSLFHTWQQLVLGLHQPWRMLGIVALFLSAQRLGYCVLASCILASCILDSCILDSWTLGLSGLLSLVQSHDCLLSL